MCEKSEMYGVYEIVRNVRNGGTSVKICVKYKTKYKEK